MAADISDESVIDEIVAAGVEAFGKIDAVHANAAVQWFGDVLDCTVEQWERTLAVNLTGVFLLARRILPELGARWRCLRGHLL